MKIQGEVHSVGELQVISDKFQKREMIVKVTDNPDYPQYLKIETTQDRTSLLDGISSGDFITAEVNINGNLWTNKEGVETAFNSIVAWRVQKGINQGTPPLRDTNTFLPVNNVPDLPF